MDMVLESMELLMARLIVHITPFIFGLWFRVFTSYNYIFNFLKLLLIYLGNIKRSHHYISFFWVFISVLLTSQTNSIELNKYTPILIGLFLSFHHLQSYKK